MVVPDPLDRRPDHPRAEAASDLLLVTDQVVDGHRPGRHLDQGGELRQILGIVGQTATLDQAERAAVEVGEEVLGGLLTPRGGAEVPYHRLGRGLMVPPPGHMRLLQPRPQQREVALSEPTPGDHRKASSGTRQQGPRTHGDKPARRQGLARPSSRSVRTFPDIDALLPLVPACSTGWMIRETRWERELHQRGSASSFLVAEDRVVVHERHTRLVCLDREEGSVRWDTSVGTWLRGLVIADGRCLVLPQGPNRLVCLDLRTGAPLWHVELPRFSGHVVAAADSVLVGGWRGYTPLAAFDLLDGRPLWRTPVPAHTALPLAWGGGVLLGHGPAAWLIDPRDGSEMARWQLPEPLADGDLRPVFTAVAPDRCLARCGARSLMLLHLSGAVDELVRHDVELVAEAAEFVGGVVWLRQRRAGYLVVDPDAGSTLWQVDVGQPLVSKVVRADDGFVVASEGAFFRLRSDGQVEERSPHAQRISTLRSLGAGKVIVTTKGTLKALAQE